VLHTGKFIDEPGGYGSDLPAGHTIGLLVHSPEEAAAMVRQLHDQGCQGIKIPLDFNPPPFSDQPRSCGLNEAEVRAICDTARELGMWVSCHVLNAKELRTLVDCGITDAGHTPKDPMPDELIADMVAKGIPMVSTVIGPVVDPTAPPAGPADMGPPPPPPPPEVQKAMAAKKQAEQQTCLDNLRRFHEAGGQVLLGTDLMFSGNYDMCACIPVLEMEALYQQGFDVQELVVAGTLAPAQASGVADRLGTIEVGKQANIIATARPIDGTFRALMAPEFVMNRGEIIVSQLG
jgi:imidazolonepropionase-like amidohydrolase